MTELLASPSWVDEVDGTAQCVAIVDVTHDVKSFTFELPGSARLRFLPGQYLTFRFELDGLPVERCYTISSPPTRPELMTITVKRVPDGVVSPWLHDRLRVGDAASVSGPYGEFSTATYPAPRYLFLTAGSGITPAMSMLRTLCDTDDPAEVVFVHCARTPADIVFRDELDALARRPRVGLAILCEADAPDEPWPWRHGLLTLATLLEIAPDLLDREIFSCGPPPFMAAVRDQLDAVGADRVRYHEESFLLGGEPAASPPTGRCHQVEFRRSGQKLTCDAGVSLLEAACRAGIAHPSSCQEGVCGTCKTQLLAGSVDMNHAGGIRPREIDQGKILLCCSTPTDDVVLDA